MTTDSPAGTPAPAHPGDATTANAGSPQEGRPRGHADTIGTFAAGLRLEDVPQGVIDDAVLRFVDTLGVALLATTRDVVRPLSKVVARHGGLPESTVLGGDARVPASQAALVNGTLAHALEYDDTNSATGIHPSCVIVPTALAVGERVGASGREVLEAAIAGWEFGIRMGLAGQNYDGPVHSTSVTGTFAAAVVAGRLLGLEASAIADALGIAGSQAAGSRQAIEEGAWSGRLHGGWPAMAGIFAAELAAEGLSGPHQVFEGRRGLYRAYVPGESYPERIVADLGTRWETPATLFKLFPCCQQTQSSMHAVRTILARDGLAAEAIERIDCYVPREAHRGTCEPIDIKARPRTTYQAAFSLPYCVAVAVLEPEVTLESYEDERRADPIVQAMTDRVVGHPDEALRPSAFQPARVIVTTRAGSTHEAFSPAPGSPENPNLREAIVEKYRANASRAVPIDQVEALREGLLGLVAVDDIRDIVSLARPAR